MGTKKEKNCYLSKKEFGCFHHTLGHRIVLAFCFMGLFQLIVVEYLELPKHSCLHLIVRFCFHLDILLLKFLYWSLIIQIYDEWMCVEFLYILRLLTAEDYSFTLINSCIGLL